MWWPGTGDFGRHYRGHCPPEIIKLKSNYGLIIVNPPPILKAFCTRNLDGIGGRCDDGADCRTDDEFLRMFRTNCRRVVYYRYTIETRHDCDYETLRSRECYFPVEAISNLSVTGFEAGFDDLG